jgi:NAD(P)-dependent dehydrogenase (short-subunit alcohol dehydrogenase family)
MQTRSERTVQEAPGRIALVTGGASGIGEGVVKHVAQLGHRIAVVDRDASGAARIAASINADGGKAIGITADVSNEDDVRESVESITRTIGQVDILVNNAGFSRDGLLVDMPTADWDDVIATACEARHLPRFTTRCPSGRFRSAVTSSSRCSNEEPGISGRSSPSLPSISLRRHGRRHSSRWVRSSVFLAYASSDPSRRTRGQAV